VGQVTVRVNGYQHTIGCKDGEEQHVLDLVSQIEEKVRLIRAMGGQFSESRMLLHVALLLADESADLRTELTRMRAGGAVAAPAQSDPQLAERLARIAERIEGLAQSLDRP
jgi:cell division protein ZapA